MDKQTTKHTLEKNLITLRLMIFVTPKKSLDVRTKSSMRNSPWEWIYSLPAVAWDPPLPMLARGTNAAARGSWTTGWMRGSRMGYTLAGKWGRWATSDNGRTHQHGAVDHRSPWTSAREGRIVRKRNMGNNKVSSLQCVKLGKWRRTEAMRMKEGTPLGEQYNTSEL